MEETGAWLSALPVDGLLRLAAVCLAFLALGVCIGMVVRGAGMRGKIVRERKDAVRRSRAVLGGQFGEQLAPYLPGFPCNPGDVHFVGRPVDYVAFPGSAQGRPVEEVILIEVKSGSSPLSERERQVRDAVRRGRVRYVEYRLPT